MYPRGVAARAVMARRYRSRRRCSCRRVPGRWLYDWLYRRGAPWESGPREELVELVGSGPTEPRKRISSCRSWLWERRERGVPCRERFRSDRHYRGRSSREKRNSSSALPSWSSASSNRWPATAPRVSWWRDA